MMDEADEGLAVAIKGLEAFWATGAIAVIAPRFAAEVAEAYGVAGRPEEGLALMRNAPDRKASGGKPRRFADIYRIEGELLWASPGSDRAEVEDFLREAVEIADEDNNMRGGLRAATSLARFLITRGLADEARDMLAPRYAEFTEGFETADVIEAKALLRQL